MAFTNRNDYLTGRKPVPFPAGGEVVACRFPIDLVAADLDANDAGAVGVLPAGCVPVGLVYDSDDLDTNGTPTIAASVGFINTAEGDLDGTAWVTGITASQSGACVNPVLTSAVMRMAATQADRKFGIKFTAAAATKAAGQVGLTLLYRTT
jgi:hypothetical protein